MHNIVTAVLLEGFGYEFYLVQFAKHREFLVFSLYYRAELIGVLPIQKNLLKDLDYLRRVILENYVDNVKAP